VRSRGSIFKTLASHSLMQIQLVGTSHIAKEALRRTKQAFEDFQPDTIAIELDQNRLAALLAGARPNYSLSLISHVGLRGYLFALIGGFFQRKLGRLVNVTPGADMLYAARLAQKEKKRLLLIDQPVQVTLRKVSRAFGWGEVKQLFLDFWHGLRGERVTFNLNSVPDEQLVEKLLKEFKTRYPRLYRVLVHERNVHMVRALRKYEELQPGEKILVVVGAGHLSGMRALLKEQSI